MEEKRKQVTTCSVRKFVLLNVEDKTKTLR